MAAREGTAGRPRTVHAILGPDSYRAEEALEGLLQAAVGSERADAVELLRGDETSWERVLQAVRSRSLFSPKRAVVVRRADALKGDGEELAAYLDEPDPDTWLILLADKPDRRRAVWRQIVEKAQVTAADALKGRALRAYLQDQLRKRRLPLGEDALEELLERVGQDLRRLMGELDKLEAYGATGGALRAEDVSRVLGRGLAQPLYRLGDAFTSRRAADAVGLLEDLLEEGEAPLRVLATLHRALRQVRGARALKAARVPREEVASRLGALPFKVPELLEAAGRWSEDELKRATEALARADGRIKSGADPRVSLTAAVAEASGAGGRSARPSSRPGR